MSGCPGDAVPRSSSSERAAPELEQRLLVCARLEKEFEEFSSALLSRGDAQRQEPCPSSTARPPRSGANPLTVNGCHCEAPAAPSLASSETALDWMRVVVTAVEHAAHLLSENGQLRKRCDYLESVKDLLEVRINLLLRADQLSSAPLTHDTALATGSGRPQSAAAASLGYRLGRSSSGQLPASWYSAAVSAAAARGGSSSLTEHGSVSSSPVAAAALSVLSSSVESLNERPSPATSGGVTTTSAGQCRKESFEKSTEKVPDKGKLKGTLEKMKSKLKGAPSSPSAWVRRHSSQASKENDHGVGERTSGFTQCEVIPPCEEPSDYGGVWLGTDASDYGGVYLGPDETAGPLVAAQTKLSDRSHSLPEEQAPLVASHEGQAPSQVSTKALVPAAGLESSTPAGNATASSSASASATSSPRAVTTTFFNEKAPSNYCADQSTAGKEVASKCEAARQSVLDRTITPPPPLPATPLESRRRKLAVSDGRQAAAAAASIADAAVAAAGAVSSSTAGQHRASAAAGGSAVGQQDLLQPSVAYSRSQRSASDDVCGGGHAVAARESDAISTHHSASVPHLRGESSSVVGGGRSAASGSETSRTGKVSRANSGDVSPKAARSRAASDCAPAAHGQAHHHPPGGSGGKSHLGGDDKAPAGNSDKTDKVKDKDKGKANRGRFAQRVKRELEKRLSRSKERAPPRSKSCERSEVTNDFAEKLRDWSVKQGHDPDYYGNVADKGHGRRELQQASGEPAQKARSSIDGGAAARSREARPSGGGSATNVQQQQQAAPQENGSTGASSTAQRRAGGEDGGRHRRRRRNSYDATLTSGSGDAQPGKDSAETARTVPVSTGPQAQPKQLLSAGQLAPVQATPTGPSAPVQAAPTGQPTAVQATSIGPPASVRVASIGQSAPVQVTSIGQPTPITSTPIGQPVPVQATSIGQPAPVQASLISQSAPAHKLPASNASAGLAAPASPSAAQSHSAKAETAAHRTVASTAAASSHTPSPQVASSGQITAVAGVAALGAVTGHTISAVSAGGMTAKPAFSSSSDLISSSSALAVGIARAAVVPTADAPGQWPSTRSMSTGGRASIQALSSHTVPSLNLAIAVHGIASSPSLIETDSAPGGLHAATADVHPSVTRLHPAVGACTDTAATAQCTTETSAAPIEHTPVTMRTRENSRTQLNAAANVQGNAPDERPRVSAERAPVLAGLHESTMDEPRSTSVGCFAASQRNAADELRRMSMGHASAAGSALDQLQRLSMGRITLAKPELTDSWAYLPAGSRGGTFPGRATGLAQHPQSPNLAALSLEGQSALAGAHLRSDAPMCQVGTRILSHSSAVIASAQQPVAARPDKAIVSQASSVTCSQTYCVTDSPVSSTVGSQASVNEASSTGQTSSQGQFASQGQAAGQVSMSFGNNSCHDTLPIDSLPMAAGESITAGRLASLPAVSCPNAAPSLDHASRASASATVTADASSSQPQPLLTEVLTAPTLMNVAASVNEAVTADKEERDIHRHLSPAIVEQSTAGRDSSKPTGRGISTNHHNRDEASKQNIPAAAGPVTVRQEEDNFPELNAAVDATLSGISSAFKAPAGSESIAGQSSIKETAAVAAAQAGAVVAVRTQDMSAIPPGQRQQPSSASRAGLTSVYLSEPDSRNRSLPASYDDDAPNHESRLRHDRSLHARGATEHVFDNRGCSVASDQASLLPTGKDLLPFPGAAASTATSITMSHCAIQSVDRGQSVSAGALEQGDTLLSQSLSPKQRHGANEEPGDAAQHDADLAVPGITQVESGPAAIAVAGRETLSDKLKALAAEYANTGPESRSHTAKDQGTRARTTASSVGARKISSVAASKESRVAVDRTARERISPAPPSPPTARLPLSHVVRSAPAPGPSSRASSQPVARLSPGPSCQTVVSPADRLPPSAAAVSPLAAGPLTVPVSQSAARQLSTAVLQLPPAVATSLMAGPASAGRSLPAGPHASSAAGLHSSSAAVPQASPAAGLQASPTTGPHASSAAGPQASSAAQASGLQPVAQLSVSPTLSSRPVARSLSSQPALGGETTDCFPLPRPRRLSSEGDGTAHMLKAASSGLTAAALCFAGAPAAARAVLTTSSLETLPMTSATITGVRSQSREEKRVPVQQIVTQFEKQPNAGSRLATQPVSSKPVKSPMTKLKTAAELMTISTGRKDKDIKQDRQSPASGRVQSKGPS